MLIWILIILLVVLLIGTIPAYPYSRGWGYSPAVVVLLILAVLLLLWQFDVIEFNEDTVDNMDDGAFVSSLVQSSR